MNEQLSELPAVAEISDQDDSSTFELGYLLGDGVHCTVWQAVHINSQTPVAVKRVDLVDNADECKVELEALKRLSHDHLVATYGGLLDHPQQQLWLLSEFMGGGSALDVMRVRRRPFDERAIRLIVRDVLRALVYLHAQDRVHRGVKAANVLFGVSAAGAASQQVSVKLAAESGVMQQLSGSASKRQTVIGAPFWLAPEIIQDTGNGVETDVWSLGITCIELAETEVPYGSLSPVRAIFMIPSKPPPKLKRSSPQFAAFLARALVKEPAARASASALLEHEFVSVSGTSSQTSLASAVGEASDSVARLGRAAAFGVVSDGDGDAVAGPDSSVSGRGLTSSRGGGDDPRAGSASYGTLAPPQQVVGDDEAFVDARWQPEWISFASKDELQALLKLSPEEIKAQLIALEDDKQRQIHRVKQEINKQRNAINLAMKRAEGR